MKNVFKKFGIVPLCMMVMCAYTVPAFAEDELAPVDENTASELVNDDAQDEPLAKDASEAETVETPALQAGEQLPPDETPDGVPVDENTFPDKNFRAYVSEYVDIDETHGYLSDDEIAAVEEMNLVSEDIDSIKGVQIFTNLVELDIANNNVKSMDLSQNVKLKRLDCSKNYLTELDLSSNTELVKLAASKNKLKALNLSANSKLRDLRCSRNMIETLDLSNNEALESVACDNNVIEELTFGNMKALESLDCSDNELEQIDLTSAKYLEKLDCSGNPLTTLDLSGNGAIAELKCYENKITSLDLTKNPKLRIVDLGGNRLKTIKLAEGVSLDEEESWVSARTVYVGSKINLKYSYCFPYCEAEYVANGTARKPAVTVVIGNTTLRAGVDYDVNYVDNVKVGYAQAIIVGKGDYTGSTYAYFLIKPAKAAVSKITTGKKYMTVKMSTKPSGKYATHYQIAYKVKGTKTWKYTSTTAQTKKITGLKKGKKYVVTVRAYVPEGDGKISGAWSTQKTSGKIK